MVLAGSARLVATGARCDGTSGGEIMPTLGKITKERGVAGQVAYSVAVTYEGGPTDTVRFVGSTYGGPVVMVTAGNPRGMFVTDPDRFGEFGPEWVRRFFA
jgi:hypothetical protein